MNFKIAMLSGIVKWLVGGELFDFVRHSVEAVNNSDMTGEEKRAFVMREVSNVFSSFVTVFVNLAIEVAVAYLKSKSNELELPNGS